MRRQFELGEELTAGKVLRRSIGRHRGRLTVGVLVLSLHQATEAAVPIAIGIFVDQAVSTGDLQPLLWCVLMMIVLFAVLSNAWKTGARQVVRAIEQETHLLRLEIAARVLDPRGHRTGLRAGELLSIATSDAEKTSLVMRAVSIGSAGVAALTVSSVALLLIDVPLGLGVAIGVPLLVLGIQALSPLLTRRTSTQQEAVASTTALATDLVSGLRTLRGIGAQHNAAERYRRSSQATLKATLRAASTNGLQDGVMTALSGLLLAAVAGVAGWFAINGRISIGELITVVGLAQFIAEPVGTLGYCGQVAAMARASAGRLAKVLSSPPLITTGAGTSVDPSRPLLSLEDVSYKSLSSLSLSLEPGELVGVLCYDPRDADALLTLVSGRAPEHEGRILIGGSAVEELDIDLVRRSVLVEQHDTDLFEGTLRSNLLAGSSNGARLDVVVAAAAATDVIAAHPEGLDYPLADRGRTLSGGQRQRLGLARALLAEPPVLVLHDPSTAVDAVTEELLAEGLAEVRGVASLGTLVFTSSPALLGKMHRVLVVQDGAVVAEGSHADLASRDTVYQEAVLR
ncbi:MAG TPA: ABC transporter ATP-binding protein [Kribbella sp.]|uniref:ABC transporter ATP-binding protein n=1 Tax=Kribbella sp. TaxID=1871183 RepID=UPI002D781EC7|nr:ABC transporter ATP-binding protein [Kribbella sp.]HET6297353.1 ABC transporter ATP-binding protein [Kribbella sp.]